jgi:predicted dehydrogenase
MATTAVMVGAGQRGFFSYGRFAEAHPEELRFVAVVDPDPSRRDRFSATHREAAHFATVGDWLAAGRLADVAFIASPDRDHHEAGIGAMCAGYDILLEKPMAAGLAGAVDLARVAAETSRTAAVAHVLRYTPFFTNLHEVVTSGRLGEIITVTHRENVSAFHMAHSFVRGNWSRAGESTPMIVQKCTHDLDILQWNLPSRVATLSSIGSLLHFLPEKAPAGATERCTAPCPIADCPYDARRYLNPEWTGWPVHVLTDDLSREGRLAALHTGKWGRCVYSAGSDVVDQQVVTMELESGASVVLVMHGHSAEESRTMRYDGTRATLRARFGRGSAIEVTTHATGVTETVPIREPGGGHGGGDSGVVRAFLEAVRTNGSPPTGATESLESHVLAYAAEEARVSGKTIDVAAYREVALAPLG